MESTQIKNFKKPHTTDSFIVLTTSNNYPEKHAKDKHFSLFCFAANDEEIKKVL